MKNYVHKNGLPCNNCTKEKSYEVCGRCREVKKYDLVRVALGLYEVPKSILLESERNKTGSRSCKKLPIDALEYSIKYYYEHGYSYRRIAKEQGVSVGTVYNVINNKRK